MEFREMKRPPRLGLLGLLALLVLVASSMAAGNARLRVLLLTGVNHHDWRSTTPQISAALGETGKFNVAVVTTPPIEALDAVWQTNQFNFKSYDVVVLNWTDYGKKPATRAWMDDLVSYVTQGGGLVVIHAASLEFHPDWSKLSGLGWHDASFGDRLTMSDDGQVVRTPKGEGPGSGHGSLFAWPVTMRATQHPIAAGLPVTWLNAEDELWHGTRGPAKNLEIIATAFSPLTKTNEPVMWTIKAGQGRVFVTLLGHDAKAMQGQGFRHTLARGCEWAATGKVTLKVPENFPKTVSSTNVSTPLK
jgi:hypothetical protein